MLSSRSTLSPMVWPQVLETCWKQPEIAGNVGRKHKEQLAAFAYCVFFSAQWFQFHPKTINHNDLITNPKWKYNIAQHVQTSHSLISLILKPVLCLNRVPGKGLTGSGYLVKWSGPKYKRPEGKQTSNLLGLCRAYPVHDPPVSCCISIGMVIVMYRLYTCTILQYESDVTI